MSIEYDKLTVETIKNSIINFKNDFDVQNLENYYYSKSFSEVLGISRRELSHSSFLAWLFDSNESHSLSMFPLQKFLEILILRCKKDRQDPNKNLFNAIITDTYSLEDVKVIKERPVENEGWRIDVYVEASITYDNKKENLRLVIENKVGSKEGADQTSKYFKHFESTKKDETTLYVYLTPLSSLELDQLEEVQCTCKSFIQINYQDLVDRLLEPALQRSISEKTKMIIKEYLQSLSHPAIEAEKNDEGSTHKPQLIMALGTEEKELLTKFWNKHNKLILSALYAINTDISQDEEVRDNINTALENLSESNKNRDKYTISYGDTIYANKVPKADIGFGTVKALESEGLINDEIFNFLRNDKSCAFQFLKKKEEVEDKELKKYRINADPELIYNNEEYYIARNWGPSSTAKFINKITSKIPLMKYEVHAQ